MFRCSHTIFRELIICACESYTLLEQSITVHQCMIKSVVMWLHTLVVSVVNNSVSGTILI
jgi:hypothetical protein